MDSQRQVELLRALVKKDISEESDKLTLQGMVRNAGRKAADLNRQFKLSPPVTTNELLLLYAELLDERASEHYGKAKDIRKQFLLHGVPWRPAFAPDLE